MAKHRVEEDDDDAGGVASLNPDEMMQGGLMDDFRGVITKAEYAAWDYNGEIEEPVLAARLTIQPLDDDGEPDGDEFVQHWSAGAIEAFAPSEDGKTPAEGDEDADPPAPAAGPYALRVGKRAQLNNNTNFAHLMESIVTAGEASKKFKRSALTASLACLESLDAHWDRIPQKKRSGLAGADEDGNKKRANDVLVVTEVLGYGENGASANKKKAKAGVATKKAAASKKAAVEEEDEEEVEDEEEEEEEEEAPKSTKSTKKAKGVDGDLTEAIEGFITDAGGKLKKTKLPGLVLKQFAADPRKSKLVKRCTEEEFVEAGPWKYDEDTAILSMKAKASKKAKAEDDEEEEEDE